MKKIIAIAIALAALGFAADEKQTFTGVITDDMCAKADHKSMNMGPDAKCVAECIKGMGGKYVLYDGKAAYILSDQKAPAKFAAQKVAVTGTLDAGDFFAPSRPRTNGRADGTRYLVSARETRFGAHCRGDMMNMGRIRVTPAPPASTPSSDSNSESTATGTSD